MVVTLPVMILFQRTVAVPQSIPNLTMMADNLYELVRSRQLAVYEDQAIRTAVQRSVVSEGARGWRIAKEKQSHKIDCVIALAMAALAAVQQGHSPGIRMAFVPSAMPSRRRRPFVSDEPVGLRIVRVPESAVERNWKMSR